jgi:hypothetical protein
MNVDLRKEILAETYQDVESVVYWGAWNFWRTYGGDLDDLIGQAHLIFIDAFDKYDESQGTELTTWLAFKIKTGLLNYQRLSYEPTHDTIDIVFTETYPAPDKSFSVTEFFDEMGSDACVVLQLFFSTPRDVLVAIRNRHTRTTLVSGDLKRRLRNRLRQMGWTARRTRAAFEEIDAAVCPQKG